MEPVEYDQDTKFSGNTTVHQEHETYPATTWSGTTTQAETYQAHDYNAQPPQAYNTQPLPQVYQEMPSLTTTSPEAPSIAQHASSVAPLTQTMPASARTQAPPRAQDVSMTHVEQAPSLSPASIDLAKDLFTNPEAVMDRLTSLLAAQDWLRKNIATFVKIQTGYVKTISKLANHLTNKPMVCDLGDNLHLESYYNSVSASTQQMIEKINTNVLTLLTTSLHESTANIKTIIKNYKVMTAAVRKMQALVEKKAAKSKQAWDHYNTMRASQDPKLLEKAPNLEAKARAADSAYKSACEGAVSKERDLDKSIMELLTVAKQIDDKLNYDIKYFTQSFAKITSTSCDGLASSIAKFCDLTNSIDTTKCLVSFINTHKVDGPRTHVKTQYKSLNTNPDLLLATIRSASPDRVVFPRSSSTQPPPAPLPPGAQERPLMPTIVETTPPPPPISM